MNDQELEALLDDIESDRVERKESNSSPEKIRETICAFANDLPDHNQPSVLFIGVDDSAKPTGLAITDQLLTQLGAIRSEGDILPAPSMDVQKRRAKDRDVAVVIVHASAAPPVRYKGRICIRSGPRRGIANADDERRLNEKRRFRDIPFDARPLAEAKLGELDEVMFRRTYLPQAIDRDVLEANERNYEEQLLSVRFAHPGPPVCPTVLGILTVGRTPTDWVPGAYVQFLRIDGAELTDPIRNQREIRGPLPELLNAIDGTLKNNIETSADITGADKEARIADYPLPALQQIARNAVLHRSYESTHAPARIYWFNDRVEIHSPGGPFGVVTKDNFGEPGQTDYRNPNVAAVMKDLGFVQRFGAGIVIAQKAMEENGNPRVEFEVVASAVAAILRRRL